MNEWTPSNNGQGEVYISFYLLTSSVVLSSLIFTTAFVSTKLNKTGLWKFSVSLPVWKLVQASDITIHVVLKVVNFWMWYIITTCICEDYGFRTGVDEWDRSFNTYKQRTKY
jgi:hypothetical protein